MKKNASVATPLSKVNWKVRRNSLPPAASTQGGISINSDRYASREESWNRSAITDPIRPTVHWEIIPWIRSVTNVSGAYKTNLLNLRLGMRGTLGRMDEEIHGMEDNPRFRTETGSESNDSHLLTKHLTIGGMRESAAVAWKKRSLWKIRKSGLGCSSSITPTDYDFFPVAYQKQVEGRCLKEFTQGGDEATLLFGRMN